jgi:hypothetical protein
MPETADRAAADGPAPAAGAAEAAVSREWLQANLERLARSVVDRVGTHTLWEWEYTLWVSFRLAEELRRAGVAAPHERIMAYHSVVVGGQAERHLAEAERRCWWARRGRPAPPVSLHWLFRGEGERDVQMRALLDGPLKPALNKEKLPKRQNEITADLQVFAQSMIAAAAAATAAGHIAAGTYLEEPFRGMPAVQALVEVKAATSKHVGGKGYEKDVAKLALMGEYYHRRWGQAHPYLGAWILAVHERARSEAGMGYFRRLLAERPIPGAERVRIVVFRPGAPPEVLQAGGAGGTRQA